MRLHSLCVNEGGVKAKRSGQLPYPGRRLVTAASKANPIPPREGYEVPPWGGLIFGEKGNEWEAMGELFAIYGRSGDLCILRTRPLNAPFTWEPSVRFNLLGSNEIPADTYAKLIVEAGMAVEETQKPDDFFIPQARDKIGWGIRLLREVSLLQGAAERFGPDPIISISRLFDILTSIDTYKTFVEDVPWERGPQGGSAEKARLHLERHYWNQPADQLGGLLSTIYNILIPYCEPEVAEVFCGDSTVSLQELELGKVLCLAIPQRLAVQRRYVATVLKGLVYQIILNRFDRSRTDAEWRNRNVIVIEQDEWQRYAVRSDCDVDLIREAAGTTYTASQTQDAVWARFHSRETAAPLIANLRNRWICQSGTDACADESAKLLGERCVMSVSSTRGSGSSTSTFTPRDNPIVSKSELRSLPPFHVIFAPAEGAWLYKKVIAMPVTASGEIPSWWFGTWNPIHYLVYVFNVPFPVFGFAREDFLAPWHAQAPFRAQFRWLLGLDGTYIVLGKLKRRDAACGNGRSS